MSLGNGMVARLVSFALVGVAIGILPGCGAGIALPVHALNSGDSDGKSVDAPAAMVQVGIEKPETPGFVKAALGGSEQ